ncbi:MAG TPA: type II and III secretion system protein [Sedimentisphaerales bacterium]|nr:type II and III secretion system protein [Sedimentisphaerales bacterium]
MARKNIGRVLSDGVIVLCVLILLCALNISVQAAIEGKAITYTISGSVPGLSGVTMQGLPNNPVTDENGNYSDAVKYGWSGTVTPVKAGYTFEPANRPYPKVTSDQSNQDYTATLETFVISGTTRMEGVVMEGLPGSPITGSDGTYRAIVDYDWSGTVTPTKVGYIFTPTSKPYSAVTRNQMNQDYRGTLITFTISGSAGVVEGVVMNGLPGNPTSGVNGTYSAAVEYGWSGTVSPTKDGYTFEPAEMPYSDLIGVQANQDYTANVMTFTISGTAGMDGVEMQGLPGAAVFTDVSGYYSASIEYGWDGTVKPVKAGWTFKPATINYTKLTSERTNQDFSPTMITLTISGTVGTDGVTMDGLPDDPNTGAGGSYSATVDYGWSGMVTPIKEGYEFTPPSNVYSLISEDQKSQNYTSKEITFTISGSVGTDSAVIKGLPGKAVISNEDGTYSAVVKYGWDGTVRPTKPGYNFDPSETQYPALFGPEYDQNYIATLLKQTISGMIRSDKGETVEEVFLLADAGGGSTTTNANGEYELTVDYGWRGKITPTKVGYTFRPTNKPYPVVTKDQTNQEYSAILRTFTISSAVMVGGTPIEGVKVAANNGGGTGITDSRGRFIIEVPYDWSGEITLSKEGFEFPSKSYTNITENYRDDLPESARRPAPRISEPIPPIPAPTPTATTPLGPTAIVPEAPEWKMPPGTEATITPTPAPAVEEEPKTPLERDIAKIRAQLENLLITREAPEEPNLLAPQEPLISNVWVDADVAGALQDIASMAGVTIIPDETVIGAVTCTLENVPLDRALEIVLAGTPYVVKKTPYYYLVCSGDPTSALFPVVSETRRIKLNYITSQAAVGLLSTPFQAYVQAEIGRPGTDTYTVVVTAPPVLMERIVSDMKKIDRHRSQVLLDARVVVMERGDLLNMGVEWSWPTINAGLFTNQLFGRGTSGMVDFGGKTASGLQIGYTPDATFTNSLSLALNLLAQNDEATILAKPQVLAQDGKVAEINVMTEEYYMMTSGEASFYYTRSELEKIESGTRLSITPHIGDNNDITLEMAIEVSDSIPRGRGSDLPVVTRRTSSNTVRIHNGGTVALAGLMENRTRLEKRRTPGLSNLPLVGGLFKNKNNVESSREIAVFVTANIIPESSRPLDFAQPQTPAIQPPIRSMGGDFKTSLRESLSRPMR